MNNEDLQIIYTQTNSNATDFLEELDWGNDYGNSGIDAALAGLMNAIFDRLDYIYSQSERSERLLEVERDIKHRFDIWKDNYLQKNIAYRMAECELSKNKYQDIDKRVISLSEFKKFRGQK